MFRANKKTKDIQAEKIILFEFKIIHNNSHNKITYVKFKDYILFNSNL